MMVMVCAMPVVVLVLQVLRNFSYPLLRCRCGLAGPLDATALSRRFAQIVEGKQRRILRHLQALGDGGEIGRASCRERV